MLELMLAATPPHEVAVIAASADDCAIVVAIGKSLVEWGSNGPSQPFLNEQKLQDGQLYQQTCDWTALGVGAPTLFQNAQEGPRFSIDRPTYSKNGTAARSTLTFVVYYGPGSRLFFSEKECDLQKSGGRWLVVQCKQGVIT